jgi:hypothetical protein
MKMLLGDFSVKIDREDIFKPTIGNESLHEVIDDNGDRVVNLSHLKISQLKVQCSHIATVMYLTVSRWENPQSDSSYSDR